MQEESHKISTEVSSECDGMRMDMAIAKMVAELSRSQAAALIKEGRITLNGKSAKPAERVSQGDLVIVDMPEPQPCAAKPQNIDIDIVFQDKYVAIINKPQGMVVHPAAGNIDGTLVNALLFHLDGLSGINGETRPGIVHRLDKDTSGLLVVAKNDEAHRSLSKQIKDKVARRVYWTIVEGDLKNDRGVIDAPIGRHPVHRKKMAVTERGRNAVTHYKVLERFDGCTLIEARLETGRTHQIRVHMAHIGHPVLGDPVYGHKKEPYGLRGQALHSKKLGFRHPDSGEWMEFESPIPLYFENVLTILRENKS